MLSELLDINASLRRLEARVDDYASTERIKEGDFPHEGKIGDIVAVLIPHWNKWIRAKVACQVAHREQYILWAIDHGMPIMATANEILPLPKDIAEDPLKTIYLGGLGNCVPAEEDFDYMKLETKMVMTKNWTARAIETFEKFAKNSVRITFIPELSLEDHRFGKIFFHQENGVTLSPIDLLERIHLVQKSVNFVEDLKKIDTITKRVFWRNNDGAVVAYGYSMAPTMEQAILEPLSKFCSTLTLAESVDVVSNGSSELLSDSVETDTLLNEYFDKSASVILPMKRNTRAIFNSTNIESDKIETDTLLNDFFDAGTIIAKPIVTRVPPAAVPNKSVQNRLKQVSIPEKNEWDDWASSVETSVNAVAAGRVTAKINRNVRAPKSSSSSGNAEPFNPKPFLAQDTPTSSVFPSTFAGMQPNRKPQDMNGRSNSRKEDDQRRILEVVNGTSERPGDNDSKPRNRNRRYNRQRNDNHNAPKTNGNGPATA